MPEPDFWMRVDGWREAMTSSETDTKPMPLDGFCYGGPCDGQGFKHTEDMRRVKIRDRDTPPQLHVYVYNQTLSEEQGRRVYLHEKIDAWRVGGA